MFSFAFMFSAFDLQYFISELKSTFRYFLFISNRARTSILFMIFLYILYLDFINAYLRCFL